MRARPAGRAGRRGRVRGEGARRPAPRPARRSAGSRARRSSSRPRPSTASTSPAAWRHEGALTPATLAERVRWQLDGWITGGLASAPRPSGSSPAGSPCCGSSPDQVIPATRAPARLLGWRRGRGRPRRAGLRPRAGPARSRARGDPGAPGWAHPGRAGALGAVGRAARARAGPPVDRPITGTDDRRRPPAWPGAVPGPAPARVLDRRRRRPSCSTSRGRPVTVIEPRRSLGRARGAACARAPGQRRRDHRVGRAVGPGRAVVGPARPGPGACTGRWWSARSPASSASSAAPPPSTPSTTDPSFFSAGSRRSEQLQPCREEMGAGLTRARARVQQ